MNKELSARERFMLHFLAVFLLAAGCIYFVIRPTIAHTDGLRENVEATLQTKLAIDAIINGTDYDGQVLELEDKIAGLSQRLLPFMSNGQLDSLVTGELLSAGLKPSSLSIGTAHDGPVAAFGAKTGPGEPAGGLPLLTQNTAQAVFSGTLTQFGQFLQQLSQIDGVYLTYADYSRPPSGAEYAFTVHLAFYMAEEVL